ncbi:Unknown protein sequence [Pseudomonas amygdali pv. sesami]|nr:Unknown protein sequence [Pseudomonas amygdali pv. sesami]
MQFVTLSVTQQCCDVGGGSQRLPRQPARSSASFCNTCS